MRDREGRIEVSENVIDLLLGRSTRTSTNVKISYMDGSTNPPNATDFVDELFNFETDEFLTTRDSVCVARP